MGLGKAIKCFKVKDKTCRMKKGEGFLVRLCMVRTMEK